MSKANFLLELGTEELPSRFSFRLARQLAIKLKKALEKKDLTFSFIKEYSTCRRLSVMVSELPTYRAAYTEVKKGPHLQAAFDHEGNPTKAAIGFAHSCGVGVEDLKKEKTSAGEWLIYEREVPQESLATILPELITNTVMKLDLPKVMRWGDDPYEFLRKVHWVVALFNKQVLDVELFGHKADRFTYGHRFYANKQIKINKELDYQKTLEDNQVIVDFTIRKQMILAQITKLIKDHGAKSKIDETLLNDVTGLVEKPVVMLGNFDEKFLSLPQEVLVNTIERHQKCFPVLDKQGKLVAKFLLVSNIDPDDPSVILAGNENVMRARLADAAFFYNRDLSRSLPQYIDKLQTVLFQDKLGSLRDKAHRLEELVGFINRDPETEKVARRAGLLAKFDLCTNMVSEFPDLQGTMGYYYALAKGEQEEVALAIQEHYMPQGANEPIPSSHIGSILAIADKLDHLAGCFSIGLIPKSDKDPYALRRAALGCVRIIVEKDLAVSIKKILEKTFSLYDASIVTPEVIKKVINFVRDRMKSWCLDQGISAESVEAVFAFELDNLSDGYKRILAVNKFRVKNEAKDVIELNKRIKNILTKAKAPLTDSPDPSLFQTEQEKTLYALWQSAKKEFDKYVAKQDYSECLNYIASMKDAIADFFDHVMVMAEDVKLKENRLKLLAALYSLFIKIADISLLHAE